VGGAAAQHLVSQYYGGSQSAGDMALTAIWDNHALPNGDLPPQSQYQNLYDNGHLLSIQQITSNPQSPAYTEFQQWLTDSRGKDGVGNILDAVDNGYNIGWTEPTSSDQPVTS
jgi:hypothetical protein